MNFTAKHIFSDITPLKNDDTGEKASSMMNMFNVDDLPFVDDGKLIGVVSRNDILKNGFQTKIKDYSLNKRIIFIREEWHVFNIIDFFSKNKISLAPVIAKDVTYIACITKEVLFSKFGGIFTFSHPGSIIEINIPIIDYSLSKLSHIVESEDTSIIGLMINESNTDSAVINMMIKLNRKDISSVLSALERHGYVVSYAYNTDSLSKYDLLKERYEALIHYLNV